VRDGIGGIKDFAPVRMARVAQHDTERRTIATRDAQRAAIPAIVRQHERTIGRITAQGARTYLQDLVSSGNAAQVAEEMSDLGCSRRAIESAIIRAQDEAGESHEVPKTDHDAIVAMRLYRVGSEVEHHTFGDGKITHIDMTETRILFNDRERTFKTSALSEILE